MRFSAREVVPAVVYVTRVHSCSINIIIFIIDVKIKSYLIGISIRV